MQDYPTSLILLSNWSIGHSEPLLLFALFYQSTPSCFKVVGWVVWGGWCGGPCDFSVSPRSKSLFFLFLGAFIRLGGLLDEGLDQDLDQGLTIKLNSLPLCRALTYVFSYSDHCQCSVQSLETRWSLVSVFRATFLDVMDLTLKKFIRSRHFMLGYSFRSRYLTPEVCVSYLETP